MHHVAAAAATLICANAITVAIAARAEIAAPAVPIDLPGRTLPVTREHTYRMAGKVRVFLLWVGRDDVGSGIITWRGNGDATAYELLIGSDPQRAPSQLNKWGYLVEEMRGGESSVVGLISQENDDQLSEVKADLKKRREMRAFDTIRGSVAGVGGSARVGTLHAPSELTYRDAGTVLAQVLTDSSLPIKHVARANGVRAGFLSTLTELIRTSIEHRQPRGRTHAGQRPGITYVHGDRLFQLRLLESAHLARFERDGRTFENVIRSRFETGEAGTRSGTRFELVYGASGPLAGIPIVISYQPKWWLQVDLVLNT